MAQFGLMTALEFSAKIHLNSSAKGPNPRPKSPRLNRMETRLQLRPSRLARDAVRVWRIPARRLPLRGRSEAASLFNFMTCAPIKPNFLSFPFPVYQHFSSACFCRICESIILLFAGLDIGTACCRSFSPDLSPQFIILRLFMLHLHCAFPSQLVLSRVPNISPRSPHPKQPPSILDRQRHFPMLSNTVIQREFSQIHTFCSNVRREIT